MLRFIREYWVLILLYAMGAWFVVGVVTKWKYP
jgi:hypothetical protein